MKTIKRLLLSAGVSLIIIVAIIGGFVLGFYIMDGMYNIADAICPDCSFATKTIPPLSFIVFIAIVFIIYPLTRENNENKS